MARRLSRRTRVMPIKSVMHTRRRQKGAPPKVSHAINEGCSDFYINFRMRERASNTCRMEIKGRALNYVRHDARTYCGGRRVGLAHWGNLQKLQKRKE